MVTAVDGRPGDGGRLILSPHAPMTRGGSLVLFAAVAVPILGVAVVCALLGAWQVLLMSSLVVVAVGAGLLSGYRRTQIDEVVSILGDTVAVDKHQPRATEHHEFQRGWAQVVLEEPLPPMEEFPSRLFIRSHGRQVQIGDFLEDEERRDLAARLQRTMGPGRRFDSCSGG